MLSIFNVYHVNAGIDDPIFDGYYLSNLDEFPNGETWVNDSVDGDHFITYKWVDDGVAQKSQVYDHEWRVYSRAGGALTTSWVNLTRNTTIYSMNITYNTLVFGNSNNAYMYLYSSDATYLGYLKFVEGDGIWSTYIYDEDDVNVDNFLTDGNIVLNITCYPTQKAINVSVWNDYSTLAGYGNYTLDTFYYPSNLKCTVESDGTGAYWAIDDFRYYTGATPDVWDINYYSWGRIEQPDTSQTVYSFVSSDIITVEWEKNNIANDFYIKQFMLSVGDSTSIDNVEVQLWIKETNLGEFDDYYTFSDRYMLLWSDLNLSYTEDDLLFEVVFLKETGATQLELIMTTNDIDDDDDIKHGTTQDDPFARNDIYDPVFEENYDLIYECWYDYGEVEEEYGYNETDKDHGRCSSIPPSSYDELLKQDCNILTCWDATTRYLEFGTNYQITGYVETVDLYIGSEQYDINEGNLELYTMYVNGLYCGKPDYFVPLDSGNYILRWVYCNIPVDNKKLVFEWDSFTGVYKTGYLGIEYWSHWVSVGTFAKSSTYTGIHVHNNINLYGNGALNKAEHYHSELDDLMLSMCYYYDEYEPDPGYNDSIQVQPVDQTIYEEYDVLTITGTISTKSPVSYIQLWKDGVQVEDHGFGGTGKRIEDYNFIENFPLNSKDYDGSWKAHLVRSGVNVSTYNFTVVDRDNYNQALYTYPNPSEIGELFTIGWLYNKTYYDNNNGVLLWGRFPEFNPNYAVIFDNIQGDDERSFSYNEKTTMYMFLCVKNGNDYEPVATHTHFVGQNYIHEIHVGNEELFLGQDYKGDLIPVTQRFYGYHSYTGSDIYILDNGNRLFNVKSQPNFDLKHTYYESGTHTISLALYEGDSYTVLDSVDFIIYDYGEGAEIVPGLSGLIPYPYNLFVGIGIILGFLFMPFAFVMGYNREFKTQISFKSEMMLYISVISGFAGYALTILWGLFPWWTIFALLFTLILIFAIKWYSRPSSAGE